MPSLARPLMALLVILDSQRGMQEVTPAQALGILAYAEVAPHTGPAYIFNIGGAANISYSERQALLQLFLLSDYRVTITQTQYYIDSLEFAQGFITAARWRGDNFYQYWRGLTPLLCTE